MTYKHSVRISPILTKPVFGCHQISNHEGHSRQCLTVPVPYPSSKNISNEENNDREAALVTNCTEQRREDIEYSVFSHLYNDVLFIQPWSQHILLLEPIASSSLFHGAMARILLKHLHAPTVLFVSSKGLVTVLGLSESCRICVDVKKSMMGLGIICKQGDALKVPSAVAFQCGFGIPGGF